MFLYGKDIAFSQRYKKRYNRKNKNFEEKNKFLNCTFGVYFNWTQYIKLIL